MNDALMSELLESALDAARLARTANAGLSERTAEVRATYAKAALTLTQALCTLRAPRAERTR
jgi:hypothetical protein